MEMFNRILYKYSNMDSSSQILIFLIILVFLMLISIIIINIITKSKNKDITNNIKRKYISNGSNQPIDDKIVLKTNMELNNIDKDEDIEIIEENDVVEVPVKRTSIDEISKMIEDTLEHKPIDLTKFEEDQEENAIISYDELVRKAGAKKIIYKCEDDNMHNDVKSNNTSYSTEKTKFKASKVISPIFGVQKEKEEKDEVLESFAELDKIKEENSEDIETISDIEFLGSLKKFRNELE